MSLKLKGFHLEPQYWEMLEEIRKRKNLSSDAFALRKCIEALYELKPAEVPKTIPAFEIPAEILEKAKQVNTCPNFEVYPRDPQNFVRCHAFEKPRIRKRSECETCNQKQTLNKEMMERLNALAQKKENLDGEIRAKQDSLRTVSTEYERKKRELEALTEKRASFQVAPPSKPAPSPDPALIKRIKELETENEELRKAPVKEVFKEKYVFIDNILAEEEVNECEQKCSLFNPDLYSFGCPYPPHGNPSKCLFFKPKEGQKT